MLGLNALAVVQGLVVARLLGPGEYGLWGLLLVAFGTLFALLAVGIDDKYINQDHPDQQAAFEIAFTLQTILSALLTLIALTAIPVFAIVYDEPRIIVPGLLIAVTLPLLALQTPVWVFYRRMDFVKQRLLEGPTGSSRSSSRWRSRSRGSGSGRSSSGPLPALSSPPS